MTPEGEAIGQADSRLFINMRYYTYIYTRVPNTHLSPVVPEATSRTYFPSALAEASAIPETFKVRL